MKKVLSLSIIFILLFAILVTPVLASKDKAKTGDVPKSADPITVDGTKDAVYDKGLKIELNRQVESFADPITTDNGTAYLVWQDGFLYVFGEIRQAYIQDKASAEEKQSGEPWMTDSLEAFLDWTNEASGGDCDQYRIDAYGYRSFEARTTTGDTSYGLDATAANGIFEGAAQTSGTNYTVEFKIPLLHDVTAGSNIGYLLQINDMDADGVRSMVFSAASDPDAQSWVAESYDYITLSATEVTAVEAPTPTEAPAAAPAAAAPVEAAPAAVAPAVANAPQTGDAGMILAIFALLASASVLVFKTRKNRA